MYSGVLFHLISKIIFVASSYGIHFFLGRYLSEASYGVVGTIITIMNFEYIFFTDGVRQGMAKAIATGKYNEKQVIKSGLIFQMSLVFLFFVVTFCGAGIISSFLGDESLTPYIRRIAYLLPFTGVQSLMLGILNGHQHFKKEAGLGMIYPILKLSIIPFVAFVFSDSIFATQMGFLVAVVVIAVLSTGAVFLVRKSFIREGEQISYREYISSALGYLLLFGASTVLMNADTLILKRFATNPDDVGYYTGVVNFAKIPYFLLTAIYTVALPVIAELYAKGELEKAKERIGKFMSLSITFVLPGVFVIAAASPYVLSLFYKPSFVAGEYALTFLIIGIMCLGMSLIFSMILSAADHKKTMLIASLLMVCLQFVLCPILSMRYSLSGTAFATLLAAFAGMLVTGYYTVKIFGTFLTKGHVILLMINALCFVGGYVFFHCYTVSNFLELVLICAGIYLPQVLVGAWLSGLLAKRRQRNY